MSKGNVYILTNPDYPNHVKIGSTTLSPQERCEQISSQTGVLSPFQVHYFVEVSDCEKVERLVHQELKDFRDSKEFFKIDREQAQKTLNDLKNKFPVDIDENKTNFEISNIVSVQPKKEPIHFYHMGKNEGEIHLIGFKQKHSGTYHKFDNFTDSEKIDFDSRIDFTHEHSIASAIMDSNRGFVIQTDLSKPIVFHGKINLFKKGLPRNGKLIKLKEESDTKVRFIDFKFSKDDRYLLGHTEQNEYFMWGITNTLLKGGMKPIFYGACDTINSIEFYNKEMKFLIQTDKKLEAKSCKDDSRLWEIEDFEMSSISSHQQLNNFWCSSRKRVTIIDTNGEKVEETFEIGGDKIITHPYLPVGLLRQDNKYVYINESLKPISEIKIPLAKDLSFTPEGKYICWLNNGVFQYSEISIDILN